MIKVEFSGETSADVHAQIKEFAASPNEVSTAPKKAAPKKVVDEEDDDDEPAPVKKKPPVKKVVAEDDDDEPAPVKKAAAGKPGAIEDAQIRDALKGLDWPIEQSRAFVNKFGFETVSGVPVKRRQELLDLIEEAGAWSAKKLSAYLEDDDL